MMRALPIWPSQTSGSSWGCSGSVALGRFLRCKLRNKGSINASVFWLGGGCPWSRRRRLVTRMSSLLGLKRTPWPWVPLVFPWLLKKIVQITCKEMPPWLVLIVKGTKAPAQYETPALTGGEGCEMKRMHENHRVRMAAIALVAAMTFGPAAAMAAPCAAPVGQGACAGACAATAASAGCLYAQACPADDAQVDCPRAGARAAWLEGACSALRCRSTRAAQTAGDWAAQRRGAFVDADGDGVCDNAQNCARANGDCPGLEPGNGAGRAADNAAGQGAHHGWGGGRR